MSVWEAVLLGIVQGLTEFLPISSTAHLLVVREWLGHTNRDDAFTTVIQLGTLVAVFVYFRQDIALLIRGVIGDLKNRRLASSPESRVAWLIVAGTIPVVIVGGLAKKWLKAHFYNIEAMAIVAIVFALLMAAAEVWAHRRRSRPGFEETSINFGTAIWIGLWQALALMPGASRSGTTLTAGLFAGLPRSTAARFSFLLSLPSVLAAGVKELYDEVKKPDSALLTGDGMLTLGIGLVVSAIVGYVAIAWLLHFLKRYSMTVFIVYRLIFGAILLGLVYSARLANSAP